MRFCFRLQIKLKLVNLSSHAIVPTTTARWRFFCDPYQPSMERIWRSQQMLVIQFQPFTVLEAQASAVNLSSLDFRKNRAKQNLSKLFVFDR